MGVLMKLSLLSQSLRTLVLSNANSLFKLTGRDCLLSGEEMARVKDKPGELKNM